MPRQLLPGHSLFKRPFFVRRRRDWEFSVNLLPMESAGDSIVIPLKRGSIRSGSAARHPGGHRPACYRAGLREDVTAVVPGQGFQTDLFRNSVMFPLWRTRSKSLLRARSIKVRRS